MEKTCGCSTSTNFEYWPSRRCLFWALEMRGGRRHSDVLGESDLEGLRLGPADERFIAVTRRPNAARSQHCVLLL